MRASFIILTVLGGIALAGCATTGQTTLRVEVAEIPQSMLHCVPPAMRTQRFVNISQKQMAILLTRQTTSAQDCHRKLEQVRRLYGAQRERALQSNARVRR